MDLTGTLLYFGSPDSRYGAVDFSNEAQKDVPVRKQVVWESETTTDGEARHKEVEIIRELQSNKPRFGHNRWPQFNDNTPDNPADRESR